MIRFDLPAFNPSRLLPNPHAQTILGSYFPGPAEPKGTRFYSIDTTMGDQLALQENQPRNTEANPRQTILLHGLAGCHKSGYMLRTCNRLLDNGYGVFRMDARGSGAGLKLARYHHHAGRSEDLEETIKYVANRYPRVPITLVGFSLGANVLLHYLGLRAGEVHPQVDSAVAVAPPVDLARCSQELESGLSRGYDLYFARVMLARLRQRREARPDMVDFPIKRKPKTLKQFDSQFTAIAGGFQNIDDYYEQASARQYLAKIKVPTLLMVDEHDPVIPISIFSDLDMSSAIQIIRTSGGGHLGYIARRKIDPDRFWLPWRIAEIVQQFDLAAKPKSTIQV